MKRFFLLSPFSVPLSLPYHQKWLAHPDIQPPGNRHSPCCTYRTLDDQFGSQCEDFTLPTKDFLCRRTWANDTCLVVNFYKHLVSSPFLYQDILSFNFYAMENRGKIACYPITVFGKMYGQSANDSWDGFQKIRVNW